MRNSLRGWPPRVVLPVLILPLCGLTTAAQTNAPQPGQQPSSSANNSGAATSPAPPAATAPTKKIVGAKRAWRVQVFANQNPVIVRLRAADAPLADIAAEMSRQLKIPIVLSAVMKGQRVTLDLADLPLETALRALAPEVCLDELVIGGAASIQPQYTAIYLSGVNETLPANNDPTQSDSQVMLMEGNTEDLRDEASASTPKETIAERFVEAKFEKNKLTLRARGQPVSVVLYEMARAMKIPFDIRHRSEEIIDTDVTDVPVEQALLNLPSSVRLYLRKDARTLESTPLRLVLAGVPDQHTAKPKNNLQGETNNGQR
ncbi:MAG: hypothetical protein ABR577_11555 [Pyrinomonadaceae bacterium]